MAVPYHRDVLDDAFDEADGYDSYGGYDGEATERPRRSIWIEEEVGTPRMADPVRSAAVRAVLVVAVTIIVATFAVLSALAGVWTAAPAALLAVVGTVGATWAVLDVWVTRQVHIQRYGVVSGPSSAARTSRRARARERRARQRAGSGSAHRPHLSGV